MPPVHYPSAAPYSGLTKHFQILIKEGIINKSNLKCLLYPEYMDKIDLSQVKIRQHKTEFFFAKRYSKYRASVINCDSDLESDSETSSSGDNSRENSQECIKMCARIEDGSSSSSSNPFGYIRYFNQEQSEEEKYKSVIDYGKIVIDVTDCKENFEDIFGKDNQKRDSDGICKIDSQQEFCKNYKVKCNRCLKKMNNNENKKQKYINFNEKICKEQNCKICKKSTCKGCKKNVCEKEFSKNSSEDFCKDCKSEVHTNFNKQDCNRGKMCKYEICNKKEICQCYKGLDNKDFKQEEIKEKSCKGNFGIDSTRNPKSTNTTTKLKLNNQLSETTSEASSDLIPKPYMACEDLVNLDSNTPLKNSISTRNYIPSTRQSLPTKFVANKFNETSLTMIYVPPWHSNSDNNLSKSRFYKESLENNAIPRTHSSSLDLAINPLPLPDGMLAELLYNFDSVTPTDLNSQTVNTKNQKTDLSDQSININDQNISSIDQTVIKPPSMFRNTIKEKRNIFKNSKQEAKKSTENLCLSFENIGFKTHSLNSDKPRRSSIQYEDNSIRKIRRCVSYQYLNVSSKPSFCRCCAQHSPRSSDSGMAGSCTLNSPDLHANEILDQRSSNVSNMYDQLCDSLQDDSRNVVSLSEIDAKLFESQCPCTSPFGSTPRTSCQPSISENVLVDSNFDSVSNSSKQSRKDCVSNELYSKLYLCKFDELNLSSNFDENLHKNPNELNPNKSNSNIEKHPLKNSNTQRCVAKLELGPKSKSLTSILLSSNLKMDEEKEEDKKGVYRSGLYAHWWLKAKLPEEILRGIYEESKGDDNAGKGIREC